jgi:hypothetical protein
MELWIANIKSNNSKPIQELICPLNFEPKINSYTCTEYEGTIVAKVSNINIKKVFISHYQSVSKDERIPLQYDAKWDVWYDIGDSFIGRNPIGINQCGTIFFEAEDDLGRVIYRSTDVVIKSSLLSPEEYEQMLDDISDIIESFSAIQKGAASQAQLLKESIAENLILLKKVKDLNDVLRKIGNAPNEQLIRKNEKVHPLKIKQLNTRLLIEKRIFPYKEKILAPVIFRSIDIPEHRMIRWSLETFEDKIYRKFRQTQLKIKKITERIESLSETKVLYRNNLNRIENIKEIENSITNDRRYLNETLKVLKRNESLSNEILTEIKSALKLPFLKVNTDKLAPTHLFHFSPLYNEIYENLADLLDMRNTSQTEAIYTALQKSPHLYEIWCLISIVNTLIFDCGFKATINPNILIQNYLDKKGELKRIFFGLEKAVYKSDKNQIRDLDGKMKFTYKKSNLKLEVHYELPFQSTERRFKPDFTFHFEDNNMRKVAYLDAKYKSLTQKDDLINIIQEVAITKYYEPLQVKPISSFLIHPNKITNTDIHIWNVKIGEYGKEQYRHVFGGFHFKPNDKENFIKWMNMLLHYHLGYDGICLQCGTNQPADCDSKDGNWKKYFTCQNLDCQAFWVKTSCFNWTDGKWSHKDSHSKESSILFKYTKHSNMNYHRETQHDWDIHCPVCDKCAQDRYIDYSKGYW